jgi:ATP-dependent 26S proteasome regulatory subunit
MTTNHNDQIDSALLRPGRIDMQIEFKKLRPCHIAEIYKKWYGMDLEESYIDDITNYKYSQAEVSQLLFKYENDPKGFISEITQ